MERSMSNWPMAIGAVASLILVFASGTIRSDAAGARAATSPTDRFSATTQSSPTAADTLPNVVVQTQDGTRVRFYDDLIKGKVVLINFMFTSCTTQCPLTTANLVKVEEALGENLGRDVAMISITVDPAVDTPAVLKKYSQRYHTKAGWYFVTGSRKDIDLIRRRLGGLDNTGDKTRHTGILIYGNEATGQWAATPAMAQPKAIVRSVMRFVARQKGD
jgi:protein SCO1/2